MSARPQPQASIYETTIENADLEAALEQREKQKGDKASATKRFKDADDKVKGLVAAADLGDSPVRVGRFVIREAPVAPRDVHFKAEATSRLVISLLDDAA